MSLDPTSWPLVWLIAAFIGLALGILFAGTALVRRADEIAEVTGISAALVGALLLGATTSLPGTVLSVSAAWQGHAELAISNAIGGILAQTFFLTVADLTYRRGNLEHAAASISTLMQAALLVAMLSLPLIAMTQPPITLWGVHPLSPLLVLAYVAGLRLTDRAEREPMWKPTPEVEEDEPEAELPDRAPWVIFLALALTAGVIGFALGEVAIALSLRTGISQTAVGGVFTATVTSLPELVTAVAAVRRGALQLAVGGIIGGNAYDVLFLSFSDVAYRDGSLYHAFTDAHVLLLSLGILMTSVLVLGMLKRDQRGPAQIGFESTIVLLLYIVSLARLFY